MPAVSSACQPVIRLTPGKGTQLVPTMAPMTPGMPAVAFEQAKVTGATPERIDWASLGLPAWLTDRVERLGFKFPTGMQQGRAEEG